MKPIKEMNIGELAAAVCTHLKQHGIFCVLSGGACVTIYSKNQYQSYDLDFIETGETDRKTLKGILAELGFFEERRYFRHKDTEYFLEFPAGPLAIGSERVTHIHEMKFETGRERTPPGHTDHQRQTGADSGSQNSECDLRTGLSAVKPWIPAGQRPAESRTQTERTDSSRPLRLGL